MAKDGARVRRTTGTSLRAFASVAIVAALLLAVAAQARAAVTTYGGNTLGDGWYPDSTDLAPGLVGSPNFGQQFSATVQGQVYAQPLVAKGTLLVATEEDDIYGLDPATGAQRWARTLGTPWNPADIGCGDLTPSVGITGTPVVDSTGTEYLFTKSYASGTSGPAVYYAHAVDVATGAERPHFPVRIEGVASNDAHRTFDPTLQLQRPGLLLLGGVVYAAFGGHCDDGVYSGWIVGVSTAGSITTMWSDETGSGTSGGIWESGGALESDGAGQIIMASGNGTVAAAPTPGTTPPPYLGNAVVRLAVQHDGSLRSTDYFAPYDAASLNGWDADVGSGAPAGLPSGFGTAAHPHLLVEVGKEGYVYLLDRDHLGGMGQGPSGGDAALERLGPDGGVWGKPAAWPGDGGYVYITTVSSGTTNYGTSGHLNAYRYGLDPTGLPTLTLAGKAAGTFGFSSSPTVVSSHGTTPGSALVWVVYAPSGSGSGAQLRAYSPVPSGGVLHLVHSWSIGTSSKFAPPAIDGNRVFVGTRDGHVLGFGSPVKAPLRAKSVTWPTTPLGQSSVRVATFTAEAPVTVTALSSSDPQWVAGASSPALPATLATGEVLTAPVTFSPTAVGPVAATLTASTDLGTTEVPLTGTGRSATGQISTAPTVVSFGGATVGSTVTARIRISNTGAGPVTVQSERTPGAPFNVSGLPRIGTVLRASSAVAVTATFAPAAPGTSTGDLVVTTSAGTVTVPMSGSATAGPHMVLTPAALRYGSIPVGGTASLSFTVTNTGGSPLVIGRSTPPAASTAFRATTTLAGGTSVAPGASLTETVAFDPSRSGAASATWSITADDASQTRTATLSGVGVTGATVPGPAAGGWTLNGTAALASGQLRLTTATPSEAGSAFWPATVRSSYLEVSFDSTIGGGSGADGLTLTLADPSAGAAPTSLGLDGGGLGWAQIPGIAVGLDTYQNGTDPSSNFVGVASGYQSANPQDLTWQATSTAVPSLRGTTRHIRVVEAEGTLTVSVDGAQVLSTSTKLPPQVLLGFTGATGGLDDAHSVSNVAITTG